jgi:hypothetical protein
MILRSAPQPKNVLIKKSNTLKTSSDAKQKERSSDQSYKNTIYLPLMQLNSVSPSSNATTYKQNIQASW